MWKNSSQGWNKNEEEYWTKLHVQTVKFYITYIYAFWFLRGFLSTFLQASTRLLAKTPRFLLNQAYETYSKLLGHLLLIWFVPFLRAFLFQN